MSKSIGKRIETTTTTTKSVRPNHTAAAMQRAAHIGKRAGNVRISKIQNSSNPDIQLQIKNAQTNTINLMTMFA